MESKDKLIEYLDEQINTIRYLKDSNGTINTIYKEIIRARDNGNRIFVMGNGGSASTSSHFVSDLLKTSIIKGKKRIKATSLTDNIPVMMAWSNDTSFENVFVNQLENFVEENDIVIGISGSGNSENVIRAIKFANQKNAKTIGLSGGNGGKLEEISNICLKVPNKDMLTIETMHVLICHLLTTMLRSEGEPLFTY